MHNSMEHLRDFKYLSTTKTIQQNQQPRIKMKRLTLAQLRKLEAEQAIEKGKQEGKHLMTVAEFASNLGVHRCSVYARIKTMETPNGDIEADDIHNNWYIDYNKYKDLPFRPFGIRRTKIKK